VNHLPDHYNSIADLLSRWKSFRDSDNLSTDALESQDDVGIDQSQSRLRIVAKVHEQGHFGVGKTLLHLKRDGHKWTNMRDDVLKVIRSCKACQLCGRDCFTDGFYGRRLQRLNQVVFTDFSGPYPLKHGDQRKSMLVLVDGFTKLVRVWLVSKPNSEAVAKALDEWAREVGAIEELQSDNATPFRGKKVKNWLSSQGMIQSFASPYHPQSNGVVERMIGNTKLRIRKALVSKPGSWTSKLKDTVKFINQFVNESTGFTPNELALDSDEMGVALIGEIL